MGLQPRGLRAVHPGKRVLLTGRTGFKGGWLAAGLPRSRRFVRDSAAGTPTSA